MDHRETHSVRGRNLIARRRRCVLLFSANYHALESVLFFSIIENNTHKGMYELYHYSIRALVSNVCMYLGGHLSLETDCAQNSHTTVFPTFPCQPTGPDQRSQSPTVPASANNFRANPNSKHPRPTPLLPALQLASFLFVPPSPAYCGPLSILIF